MIPANHSTREGDGPIPEETGVSSTQCYTDKVKEMTDQTEEN